MAVTHTGGGDLSIVECLLLARDRREVILSPELIGLARQGNPGL